MEYDNAILGMQVQYSLSLIKIQIFRALRFCWSHQIQTKRTVPTDIVDFMVILHIIILKVYVIIGTRWKKYHGYWVSYSSCSWENFLTRVFKHISLL